MMLRTIVSLVLVCGLGSCAHAQGLPLYQSLVERVTLTGDWGGLRSMLAAQGIDIGFANYGDTIAVVSGGAKHETRYADLLEPTVAVDLGTVRWLEQQEIFLPRHRHVWREPSRSDRIDLGPEQPGGRYEYLYGL